MGAIQTYELVDKHIRRLDSDLARFESEIKEKSTLAVNSGDEEATAKNRKKSVEKVEKKKPKAGKSPQRKKLLQHLHHLKILVILMSWTCLLTLMNQHIASVIKCHMEK